MLHGSRGGGFFKKSPPWLPEAKKRKILKTILKLVKIWYDYGFNFR
jgi:hypothetical protein